MRPIKRSNKVCQALSLPKVLSLNPRSIYNCKNELVTFVEEESIQLICISESWERKDLTLDNLIKIDGFKVISNVHQRQGKGGRPAIIANTEIYNVENLTDTCIDIPWGVEAVWAVLTPKSVTYASKIQKIVVGSIYCKPNSKKKTLLLDHIAQVYSQLSSKYKKGLHWILCGDTNDLKLDSILHLNGNLKQVVKNPTRLNPPRILDPIITTLSNYYQEPVCLPPLDPDPDTHGKPADHMMVVMKPVSVLSNKPARAVKRIIYRPVSDKGLARINNYFSRVDWKVILGEESANKKAEKLQNFLVSKYEEFFPEKVRVISSDDQPFISAKLKVMKRRKCREYQKHRCSIKWKFLETKYKAELEKTKREYYRRKIKSLRKLKPKNWHREIKKLSSFDQNFSEEIDVESIRDLSVDEQAEKIAENFASISQEYEELKSEDIKIPSFSYQEIPQFNEKEVREALQNMDANKSNVRGDIPAKVLKACAESLAMPISDLINTCMTQGIWPDIFKIEVVTPVPKVNPPKDINQLRNISG